jgi:uncharacterized protein (DUF1778 family)
VFALGDPQLFFSYPFRGEVIFVKQKHSRSILAILLCICVSFGLTPLIAFADPAGDAVHVYAPTGDEPGTAGVNESPDVASAKYQVKANGIEIPAIRYDARGYDMDVARFASEDATPEFEITLINSDMIDRVQVYPERYYPPESMAVSPDKKTLRFTLSDKLRYAIVYINGSPLDQAGKPYLTLLNDPMEDPAKVPSPAAPNVLNFKTFSDQYLLDHPITDTVGAQCVVSATIQDYSRNNNELMTWTHDNGYFVAYDSSQVQFPNKRVRLPNDVSDALQAALETIKNNPALDTLYFPSGTYLWSGLRIIGWNGDADQGGKPLTIYTEEGALLKNRLQECREALEPAIYIKNSSYVTVNGRGIFDGQGGFTVGKDNKDARNSPHQGGSMLLHSNNIVFNDTYLRDAKQWNWECHTVQDVSYNNIKGLSPYNHSWVDGLDLTSGVNVIVNGAVTLGNDDCFASGHYNPSNEFPARIFTENRTDEMTGNRMAAAYYYNGDRLFWDTADSENISVSNSLHWTRNIANGIRTGHNTFGYELKSYSFDNFNAMNYPGNVRFQNRNNNTYPNYASLTIKNSSFSPSAYADVFLTPTDTANLTIPNVLIENTWISNTEATGSFRNITNLTIRDLYRGGRLVEYMNQANLTFSNIGNFVFTAGGAAVRSNTLPVFTAPDGVNAEAYGNNPFVLQVAATDADAGDAVSLGVDMETLPAGADFDADTGRFTWRPGDAAIGNAFPVTFYAYDTGARAGAYPPVKKTVTISVLSPAFIPVYTTVAADATLQSWQSQKTQNFGSLNYLITKNIAANGSTYGSLGEKFSVTSTSDSNDGKIALLRFSLNNFAPYADAFEKGSQAKLILTYYGRRNSSTGPTNIRVAAVSGNWTETGVTWNTRPTINTDGTGAVKASDSFDFGPGTGANPGTTINGSKVEVDVTDFVKTALENDQTTLSLAVSDAQGKELWFVSREGSGLSYADASMTPTLSMGVEIDVAIEGPAGMSLRNGYALTASEPFVLKGKSPPITVTKLLGDEKITWNAMTQCLDIAPGLSPGTYPVTLKAINADDESALHTFALTVLTNDDALQAYYDAATISASALNAGYYTASSWDALQDALSIAADVLASPDSDQDEIDAVLEYLTAAFDALILRPVIALLISATGDAGDITAGAGYTDNYPLAKRTALEAALAAATDALAHPENYTDAGMSSLWNSLHNAIIALQEPTNTPKAELDWWIKYAEELLLAPEAASYIPAAKSNLQGAIDAAKLVYGNAASTDADFLAEAGKIQEAVWQLYDKGDKTELQQIYDLVKNYAQNIYTADSWAVFKDALDAAEETLDDENAIESDVVKAYQDLIAGEAQLALKTIVDFTVLNAAITAGQKILNNKGDYIASSIVGLQGLVTNAQTLLTKPGTTQAEVNAAADALRQAIAKARLKPDRSPLLSALALTQGLSLSDFTVASAEPLAALVAQGKVLAGQSDEMLSQAQIDALAQQILNAVASLVPIFGQPQGSGNAGSNLASGRGDGLLALSGADVALGGVAPDTSAFAAGSLPDGNAASGTDLNAAGSGKDGPAANAGIGDAQTPGVAPDGGSDADSAAAAAIAILSVLLAIAVGMIIVLMRKRRKKESAAA